MKDRRLTFHPATIAHRALLVAGLLLLPALALPARTPRLYTQETEHVRVIYYSPAHEYLVAHLMRSFENALKFDNRVIRYQPSQKVTVLLEDFSDYGWFHQWIRANVITMWELMYHYREPTLDPGCYECDFPIGFPVGEVDKFNGP